MHEDWNARSAAGSPHATSSRDEAIEREPSDREFLTATIAECIAAGVDTNLEPPSPAVTLIHRIITTRTTTVITEQSEPWPTRQESPHV